MKWLMALESEDASLKIQRMKKGWSSVSNSPRWRQVFYTDGKIKN